VKSSIRTSALIRRDTVSDVARGPDKDKPHLAGITVTVLDCTPEVRHDNFSDRHFKDDLWQYKERTVSFRRPTR
jgi:hypothetical protein